MRIPLAQSIKSLFREPQRASNAAVVSNVAGSAIPASRTDTDCPIARWSCEYRSAVLGGVATCALARTYIDGVKPQGWGRLGDSVRVRYRERTAPGVSRWQRIRHPHRWKRGVVKRTGSGWILIVGRRRPATLRLDGTTLERTYQTFDDKDFDNPGIRFVCSSPLAQHGIEFRLAEDKAERLRLVLRHSQKRQR